MLATECKICQAGHNCFYARMNLHSSQGPALVLTPETPEPSTPSLDASSSWVEGDSSDCDWIVADLDIPDLLALSEEDRSSLSSLDSALDDIEDEECENEDTCSFDCPHLARQLAASRLRTTISRHTDGECDCGSDGLSQFTIQLDHSFDALVAAHPDSTWLVSGPETSELTLTPSASSLLEDLTPWRGISRASFSLSGTTLSVSTSQDEGAISLLPADVAALTDSFDDADIAAVERILDTDPEKRSLFVAAAPLLARESLDSLAAAGVGATTLPELLANVCVEYETGSFSSPKKAPYPFHDPAPQLSEEEAASLLALFEERSKANTNWIDLYQHTGETIRTFSNLAPEVRSLYLTTASLVPTQEPDVVADALEHLTPLSLTARAEWLTLLPELESRTRRSLGSLSDGYSTLSFVAPRLASLTPAQSETFRALWKDDHFTSDEDHITQLVHIASLA